MRWVKFKYEKQTRGYNVAILIRNRVKLNSFFFKYIKYIKLYIKHARYNLAILVLFFFQYQKKFNNCVGIHDETRKYKDQLIVNEIFAWISYIDYKMKFKDYSYIYIFENETQSQKSLKKSVGKSLNWIWEL
jgi:hypothetical protein